MFSSRRNRPGWGSGRKGGEWKYVHINQYAGTERLKKIQEQDRESPVGVTKKDTQNLKEITGEKEEGDEDEEVLGREEEKWSYHDGATLGPIHNEKRR